MKKALIIIPDSKKSYFWKQINRELGDNYIIESIYRDVTILEKIFRKLEFLLLKRLSKIWYGNWKNLDEKYDYVILFDSITDINVVKFLEKKFNNTRIIFWFWNPIKEKIQLEILKYLNNKKIEIWSFELNDCIKYNLKYNSQFYFHLSKSENKIIRECFFVGKDKGRLNILKKIESIFVRKNLKTLFYIMKDKRKKYSKYERKNLSNKFLDYKSILERVMESRSILEINQENQNGITLRTMEALFFSKKLITNNKDIKKYDFYRPENIYIIDTNNLEASLEHIEDFLNCPYKRDAEKFKENYEIKSWIKRIENNEIYKI